jgi:hypothetical protein
MRHGGQRRHREERVIEEMAEAEAIARVCHEANRAYCSTIGDDSQPSWEDAPDWQRESAINGVLFHQDNPLANPIDSHESWMKEKLEAGWTYGAVKDPDAKTHPCILPYHELPLEQRLKDSLFMAIVHALHDMYL